LGLTALHASSKHKAGFLMGFAAYTPDEMEAAVVLKLNWMASKRSSPRRSRSLRCLSLSTRCDSTSKRPSNSGAGSLAPRSRFQQARGFQREIGAFQAAVGMQTARQVVFSQ
jgi:hypothetical protein